MEETPQSQLIRELEEIEHKRVIGLSQNLAAMVLINAAVRRADARTQRKTRLLNITNGTNTKTNR